MATCALTSGYTFIGCKDQAAGADEVYIAEYDNVNVDSMTVASDIITALTCKSGKKFWKYVLDKERGEYSYDLTGNKETSINTFLHKVSFTTNKLLAAQTLQMGLVAKNFLLIIVKGNDGVYRFFGRVKGMELVSGTNQSAKELAGFHGSVWSFESVQPGPALEVDSTLIATLLAPASP